MAGTSPRQQLPIGIQRSRPKVMRRLQNWTHIGQSSSAFIGRVRSTQFCSRKRNMTDVELARALESGEIANENFRHASHLHVAWVYLAESSSVSEATSKMRNTLRRFAAAAGKPEKYHETITLFWMYLLSWVKSTAGRKSLQEFVQANPRLLEKNLPLTYYSRERLFSGHARTSWVEPDLKPLLFDATSFCSSSSPGNPSDRSLSR
jgi:hypothetical protein